MTSHFKLWFESFLLGALLFGFGLLYLFLQTDNINIVLANKALAFSGLTMINLSFIVSGTSYFWGLGKSKLGYRKMVGVVGFLISLLHASIASHIFSGSYLWVNYITVEPKPTVPAAIAILIMFMMVIVSNFGMPARLGAKLWRQLLRIGYIAIVLLIIHLSLQSFTEWTKWFHTFKPILPPLSLWTVLFSALTLFMRISLFISLRNKTVINQPIKKL